MTDLYFGGAEIPGWRTLLGEEGVEHVSLSYMGLRRRVKFSRPWLLADKFPAEQKIFLDSGAYTVNQDTEGERYSVNELKDIAAHYMAFVQQNIDRVEFVSEFDSLALGLEWIKAMREEFYDDLPEGKFLPVWHSDWGLDELERLCQRYPRVGVMQTALGGRNLVPTLNNYARQYGVKFHGIAMTKPDTMAEINWDSVASTSWISPSQYGDTIIWTGRELKRYPKKMKETARKRHRTYLIEHGFDAEAIESDDSRELLRLSIWSWRQVIADLNREPAGPELVTPLVQDIDEVIAENEQTLVGTPTPEMRKPVTTVTRRRDASTLLPVMGLTTVKGSSTDANGQAVETTENLLRVRSESQRMCSSCFLAAKCPAYEAGANCAYSIPITIRTKDEIASLQNSLLEMQTQRVLFARMAEEIEGGYPDPNLSQEVDRLQKMIKVKTELEQDSFTLRVEAKGRGGGEGPGIMSRLFGADAGAAARALPAPVQGHDVEALVIEELGIEDAEIVDDIPARSN